MKRGKIIETPLPEALIQDIQSCMSGKEAARSTVPSKSWYNAWLTRPTIDLDERHFKRADPKFVTFATKTIQRYIDLSFKIDRLRLRMMQTGVNRWAEELIVNAMKMGATDVQLEMPCCSFTVPHEVLGSLTLVRLSLMGTA